MIKTDSSNGLPSSKRGGIKKCIIVFITIIVSLLMTYTYRFNKNKSVKIPDYSSGNEIVIENIDEKIINNKIDFLRESGYSNITYLKNNKKIILLKSENFEDYTLNNYQFYAEYTVINIENKDFIFKSSKDANAFVKTLQKYGKIKYKESNKVQEIGKETPQNEIDKIILSKKSIAEKEKAKKKNVIKKNQQKTYEKKTIKKESAIKNTKKSNQKISANGIAIVNYAKQFNGKRYVLGGQWNGEYPYVPTDCSGFVQGVYRHFGYKLPRTARQQAKVGKPISWSELQPGDLVFYSGNGGKSVTHVAMYIGNGKIIHAQTPQYGIGITTANIMIKMGARRILS